GHLALDDPVPRQLVAAASAPLDVSLDSADGRRRRLAAGGRDQIGLDVDADRTLAHRPDSFHSGRMCPSRGCRNLSRAWKTWARALSAEHWRLGPMAS